MSGSVILASLNFGFPGTVSRIGAWSIQARLLPVGAANVKFGEPVFLQADNTVLGPNDTTPSMAAFAGVAVAEVKQQLSYTVGHDDNVSGYYAALQMLDYCEFGTVIVKCTKGTPTAGGAVYMRKVLNGAYPLQLLGAFEAEADSTNTFLVTNCIWNTGKRDANNNIELVIRTINV